MHTAMKLLKGAYRRGCLLLLCLIVWLFAVGLYHTVKPLPDGITVYGREWRVPEDRVRFLFDLTYENRDRDIVSEQEIFDTAFAVIENARRYILIDMFLFNSRMARVSGAHRNLAGELTALLIEKKRRYPLIVIDLITDDINTVYGGAPSPELTSLSEAGVNVVITNHKPLRDSNPIYSSVWRTCFQWFGNADSGGIFPHPFSQSGERVTLRSYLALLNFKANHRKVIVADDGDTLTGLIISANCHDAS